MTDLKVGNNSLGFSYSAYNNPFCIIDSGSTNIYLPYNVYNVFIEKFLGNIYTLKINN